MPKLFVVEFVVCFLWFLGAIALIEDTGETLGSGLMLLGLAYYLTNRVCQERKFFRDNEGTSLRSGNSEVMTEEETGAPPQN